MHDSDLVVRLLIGFALLGGVAWFVRMFWAEIRKAWCEWL